MRSTKSIGLVIVSLISLAISVYCIYDTYTRSATRKQIAQERVIEDRAVTEIRKLGGLTNHGGSPLRVTSLLFMTTATEINGKIVKTKPKITDEGLLHLKALTVLQTLDLTNTKVTDAGLIHLKGLGTLETLNLNRTKVTDSGLEHLKGLTKLQMLDLSNTNVTDAGVKKLQLALPKCKILR